MITIRAFYKSTGRPASSKRVGEFFEGLLWGNSEAFTDSGGDAHFDVDPGTATIYVSGDKVYHGQVAGRTDVHV